MSRSLPVLPFRSDAANMTEFERWLRILGGLTGPPLAYVVTLRLDGVRAIVATVAVVAGAIDLVVTGLRGYCPVYRYVSVPWATTSAAHRVRPATVQRAPEHARRSARHASRPDVAAQRRSD